MSQVLRQHFEEIIQLNDAEFEYILSHFVAKKYRKHQFVIQEGAVVDQEFFVVKGLLKASLFNLEGKEHIVQFAMENWWVSDYEALNNHTPARLNIDCIANSELLCISFKNKNKLCAEFHKLEHFFRIKTSSGYVSLQKRILSLLSNDAQTRYRELFEKYPALFQRVPKSLIAAYLGVSRETLSRFKL